MDLCDLNTIRLLLGRHGFRFSRSMGQNFLIEGWVPRDIAEASGADSGCGVLEIGPGIGPLTVQLARRAGQVAAVELDRALLPILSETLAPCRNVTVIPGDIMKLDLAALVNERLSGLTPIACANLPEGPEVQIAATTCPNELNTGAATQCTPSISSARSVAYPHALTCCSSRLNSFSSRIVCSLNTS